MLKEKIVGWRPEQMELDVAIIDTKRFPLDTNNTVFTVKLEPTMNGGTKVKMLMKYRTKPAMMGGMMKKSFTKRLNDYLLAVHHHVKTGETVTVNNFKGIKKQYASR